jgi:8-amino-7-oxononanoate synthase
MNLPEPLQFLDRTRLRKDGREFIYFGGCDYLGLAEHPEIAAAVRCGLDDFGFNVSASRVTTGNHPVYAQLEQETGKFFGAESAVIFSSGYLSNLAVAQSLEGEFSHALMDERAHVSLADAAPFLGCPILRFRHRSVKSFAEALSRCGEASRPILLTDGMFAHDGSTAPLAEYLALLPADGLVLLDDAHGAGVLGEHGRGTPEWAGTGRERIIQTITFSKAFGAYGGAALASREICGRIVARSRAFAGNTPPPLPIATAARAGLRLVEREKERRHQLDQKAGLVKQLLRNAAPFENPTPGPVIGVAPRTTADSKRISQALITHEIWPPLVCYPGGPAEGSFRFALSSEHTQGQLESLVSALQKCFNT